MYPSLRSRRFATFLFSLSADTSSVNAKHHYPPEAALPECFDNLTPAMAIVLGPFIAIATWNALKLRRLFKGWTDLEDSPGRWAN